MKSTKEFMQKNKMILFLIILLVGLYVYMEYDPVKKTDPKKVEFNTIPHAAESTEKNHEEDKNEDYWDFDGNMKDELADADHEFTKEELGTECTGANSAFISSDLLPKVDKKDQPYSPDLKGMKLLDPEDYIGMDTISNTLRNANLSLRADPPNPKTPVSPWMNSTIDNDPYRKGLECV